MRKIKRILKVVLKIPRDFELLSKIVFWRFYRPARYNRPFIVIGEARSGSTWLMELLTTSLEAMTVWEPFHPQKGLFRAYGWRLLSTNSAQQRDSIVRDFKNLENIQNINKWAISKNEWGQLTSRNAIVKTVRLMPSVWTLYSSFNSRLNFVILLRNPIEIGLSQIRSFGKKNNLVRHVYVPEFLNSVEKKVWSEIEDNELLRQVFVVSKSLHEFYRNAANFPAEICIEYSNLLNSQEKELSKIFKFYNCQDYVKTESRNLMSSTALNGVKQKYPGELKLLSGLENRVRVETIFRLYSIPMKYLEILEDMA